VKVCQLAALALCYNLQWKATSIVLFTFRLFVLKRFRVLLFLRLAYRPSAIKLVASTLALGLGTTTLFLLLLFLLLGTRTRWTEDLWDLWTAALVVSWFVVVAEQCVVRATSTSWPSSCRNFLIVVHVSMCPPPTSTRLYAYRDSHFIILIIFTQKFSTFTYLAYRIYSQDSLAGPGVEHRRFLSDKSRSRPPLEQVAWPTAQGQWYSSCWPLETSRHTWTLGGDAIRSSTTTRSWRRE